MRNTRVLLASMSGLALAALLVACSPTPAPAPEVDDSTDSTVDETTEPVEETPEETTEPAPQGDFPAWAKPFETVGELIGSGSGDGFQVDVYQVGTAQATKTGQFATPDGEPVIAVGADIVFINYVVTNTSGGELPLTSSLVSFSPRYESWPYLQGMDSVVDFDLYEQMKVNNSAIEPGSGSAPYAWPDGTSFAYGTNFLYEEGGPIAIKVTFIPALADGSLDHDKRQEFTIDAVTP